MYEVKNSNVEPEIVQWAFVGDEITYWRLMYGKNIEQFLSLLHNCVI